MIRFNIPEVRAISQKSGVLEWILKQSYIPTSKQYDHSSGVCKAVLTALGLYTESFCTSHLTFFTRNKYLKAKD